MLADERVRLAARFYGVLRGGGVDHLLRSSCGARRRSVPADEPATEGFGEGAAVRHSPFLGSLHEDPGGQPSAVLGRRGRCR